MKKNIARNISILLMVPLACMCAKEGTNDSTDPGLVTIKATVDDTKVDFAQDDEKLTLSWSEGDALMVVGDNSEVYTIKPGFSDHDATFEGNAVEGSSFDVFYPASYDSVDGLISRSYTSQEQVGNADMAHLEFNALASGLEDYSEVNFGADGVLCNGVLKMVVKLPATVTAASSISLSAPDDIFYTTNGTDEMTNTLSLALTDCTIDTDGILTAYMMTSWQDVTIEAGTKLTIEVTAPGKGCTYTKTFSNPSEISLNGGACLNIDISEATTLNHKIKGSGTEEDPYLLYDAEDMLLMNGLLVAGKQTFFKMEADIDMKGIDWNPENQGSPYRKDIDFDGNGKTISNFSCTKSGIYSGFIGVLSGRIANVTFENPVVEAKSKHSGIICGYAGSSGTLPAIVENVTIKGGKITQSADCHTGFIFGHSNVANCKYTNINIIDGVLNQNGIGDSGFIGGAQNIAATFTNCHVNGTLTVKSTLSAVTGATNICSGGIQGYDGGSKYENCSFAGTINGGRLCGGIVGYNKVAGISISDCHADATINSVKIGEALGEEVGGIIAWVEGGNISECSFEGNITAAGKDVGGIAGVFVGGKGQIEKCDSYANISTSKGYVGGIAGRLTNGTISECTYQAKDGSKISNSAGNNVGGIVGWNETGDVLKCSVNTDITSNVSYVGGIIGNFYKGTISDCTYTGKISAGNYVGGIAGSAGVSNTTDTRYPATIKITNCVSNASITSASGNVGGICGIVETSEQSNPSAIECCYCKGTVIGNGGNTGGIIGYMKSGKISECWYSGNMTVKDNSGGIAGAQNTTNSANDVIIENCYTTGTITNNGSQKCGGIAGECYQNSKIRNCYSTMSISGGGRVFGGIAGRFNNNQWNGGRNTDFHMEVTNSIAAGSINSTATNIGYGSSGAVLGNAPAKVAHYTNCWRIYGFSFQCDYSAGAGLVDQGYTVTTYSAGTNGAGAGGSANWWPYHASEASASALQTAYSGWTTSKTDAQITVSDIAAAIRTNDANGWKSDIWDLSGDYPTLKNNPEPVD